MNAATRLKGFTLLEILVVLVILGLISGLLFQGFGYTLIQKDRILNQLGHVQTSVLQEFWFRNSVQSITLPEVNDLNASFDFQGTDSKFNSVSLFPLDAPLGIATRVSWWLESEQQTTSLYYSGAKSEKWRIASWATESVSFSYRDNLNRWHKKWPSDSFPEQLPVGILLTISQDDKEIVWYSRIVGDKKAPINPTFNQ